MPEDRQRPNSTSSLNDVGDLSEAQTMLKRLESSGTGGTVAVRHEEETEKKTHIDTETRYTEKVHTGHASSVLFICTMFILAVTGILFISPMVLLINNKEQLTNDLNDGLYAYYTYSNKVLGGQLGTGCGEKTIKCKFQTMSPMLKERFERYGFRLTASQAANKRYTVSSLIFPNGGGAAINATTLNTVRKSNHTADDMANRVYSARTGIYQDRQFFDRLLNRFGILQDNTLSGASVAEFDDEFDRRVAYGDDRYTNAGENVENAANMTQVSQESIDENGRGIYSLKSLSEMSDAWRTKIYANLEAKANTHLALACSYATYGSMIENAAARAKLVSTARFAMNYLAVADDLKFGTPNSGEIAVESLAGKLTQTNSNGKNAMDADTYRVPALGESIKNKPSLLAELSPIALLAILKLGAPSALGTDYLKGALTGNIVQNAARDKSAPGLCAEGMSGAQMAFEQSGRCWGVASMPLAGYIGIGAGTAISAARDPIENVLCNPLGYPAVINMVKAATTPEIVAPLTSIADRLRIATLVESRRFSAATTGVAAQNIIFAGTGAILGDRAQSLGMRPANAATLPVYLGMAQTAHQQTEEAKRVAATRTPWDAANPYSFLGTVVAKFVPAGSVLPTGSWQASVSSLLSSLPIAASSSLQTGASALYSQPLHFQLSRLQPATACGIQGGLDLAINPDFACNIRYSMSPEELSLDTASILDYMTKPHPENAQKTLAEITARDTSADPVNGDRMKQQARDGSAAPYIDPVTGKPNKYTEYAKFMQYCVNRQDPWGGVGMAVDELEPQYPEDPIDEKGRRTSDNLSGLREQPDPELEPNSYYGLGWGSAADQDWYTGKKCTDDSSEMMKYFRGYTMACAVLASMSGSRQCWDEDTIPNSHDDFYTTNNIIFKSSS